MSKLAITIHELREQMRRGGGIQDPDSLTDDQIKERYQAFGYDVQDEHPTHRAERERIERENAAAGESHGLAADEVTYCKANGIDLARYEALKDVGNIDQFRALGR